MAHDKNVGRNRIPFLTSDECPDTTPTKLDRDAQAFGHQSRKWLGSPASRCECLSVQDDLSRMTPASGQPEVRSPGCVSENRFEYVARAAAQRYLARDERKRVPLMQFLGARSALTNS